MTNDAKNREILAQEFQSILRGKGDYSHVYVCPRGAHLNVEVEDGQRMRRIVARATPLGAGEYGLSFRTHAGRWEPMPVSGSMQEVVDGLILCLKPFLDPFNL